MCLIIAPGNDGKGALLPRDVFDYVYGRNSDGFGAMWTEDGRVQHFKSLDLKADEIYGTMEEYVEKHPDVVFHMRYKTHGKVIKGLSHPFRILHKSRHGKDLFFMHNGILGSFGNNLKYGQSDTTVFKDKILVPLLTRNPDALDDPETWAALEKLTSSSRLFFMDSEGKTWISSKNTWNDRYGLTLSNEYMLPARPYVRPSYTPPAKTVVIGTPPKTPTVTSQFVHFREIIEDGAIRKSWMSCPKAGYLRSEEGKLYKDNGPNRKIYSAMDYIPKEKEASELLFKPYDPNTDDENAGDLNVSMGSVVGLDGKPYDDDDDALDDPLPDDFADDTKSPAPMDQRLRYARLVHNLLGGGAIHRTQLLADLISMGEQELGGFVSEDPVNAHSCIAELIEMILEYNDELFKVNIHSDKVIDADEICERGDVNYHMQAMKDMSAARKEKYTKMLNIKKEEEGIKNAKKSAA